MLPKSPDDYYLIENPNRNLPQNRARRDEPSGVVILHTAESIADEVGPDDGAENVAAFIARRTNYGSYHVLSDSDGSVLLVPPWQTAYGDGTGTNDHGFHISAATQAAKWNSLSREWREATVRNMAKAAADYAGWLKAERGISIPARRISRAESDRKVPGFITHGERDPGRRYDPGKDFPFGLFLDLFDSYVNGPKLPPVPDPTRGDVVDKLIPGVSRQIHLIQETKAPEGSHRDEQLDGAEVALRTARRHLRRVKIINAEAIAEAKAERKDKRK